MFRRKNGRNILGSDEPGRLHFPEKWLRCNGIGCTESPVRGDADFLTLNPGGIVDGDLIVGHKDV